MKVMALFLSLASSTVYSAETVTITSFNYTGPQNAAAELCGRVSGMRFPSATVKITADPQTRAMVYNTLADSDGRFCAVIGTTTGQARAQVWGSENKGAVAQAR